MVQDNRFHTKYQFKPIRGLNRVEAAEYVGIGTTLFDKLIKEDRMPSGKKLDGRVIWDIRQLDRVMDDLFELNVDAFASYGQHV
jgi:predicted DNA-binding transcriptional regulator AlpA